MKTIVHKINRENDNRGVIEEAAARLAEGGLVVFPTETVYGLGASAIHPAALSRLRDVKQRTESKPFTVHIGSRANVHRFVPELHGMGERLAQKAWPGPLTLIFQVDAVESAPVIQETSPEHAPAMYHEGTIGIRCPDDPVALELLTGAGVPVVAASANPAGEGAPITADEALEKLDGQVDIVLDAGRTLYGKPSTIVRVNSNGYRLVREGVIDERTLRRLTEINFLVICSGNTCRSPMAGGILRRLLAERIGCEERELEARGYHVESAGISAGYGAPPSPAAVQVMKSRNIDISSHRSQPLSLELVHRADHILAMTAGHLETLASLTPTARDRARLIDEQNIEDPIGETEAVYARCADQLDRALRQRLQEIRL